MKLQLVLFFALIGLIVGALFWNWWRSTRRRLYVPPLALRALIPESRFVEVDDVRIHYVQAGTGPDLVLLHGIGASIFAWRFLFPLLEGHFRVTAMDLPGFGKSSKSGERDYGLDAQTGLLKDALNKIGIQSATLVGSSMGGAIALWMGKVFPGCFARIITLAPATDPRLVPEIVHRLDGLIPILRRALNRHTMRVILKQVIAKHDLITDEVVDRYLEPFLDDGESIRAFWGATKLLADPRLPEGLSGLNADILIIYGDRDRRVPPRVIERLTQVLPQATLLRHEGGGHHIMEDEPQWTAETIVKFASRNF